MPLNLKDDRGNNFIANDYEVMSAELYEGNGNIAVELIPDDQGHSRRGWFDGSTTDWRLELYDPLGNIERIITKRDFPDIYFHQ